MTSGAHQQEFLTVKELAELLRIKERKVYDLVASGEVPCSRVTGKLLFPERAVRAWIADASSGIRAVPRPDVVLGSHDPLLDWALRQSRSGLATFFDGSLDGLARFRAREGVAAGLHVYDPASGDWNVGTVAAACSGVAAVLVGWATRQRGLVLRPEHAGEIRGFADLAGRRIAPRQPESGAQTLFDHFRAEVGLEPADFATTATARNEGDAVLAVVQGHADAAFGLEALAHDYQLAFVPIVPERFDLLVSRRAWFEPPMQRFLAYCSSDAFRTGAAAFAGYDLAPFGEVRWNG